MEYFIAAVVMIAVVFGIYKLLAGDETRNNGHGGGGRQHDKNRFKDRR